MDKLTPKQKGFVKDYIETRNGVQSALNNYDTEDYNTAHAIAVENLQKPTIQNAIKSIADSFTNEEIVQKHKELLNSTRVEHMVFPLGPKTNSEKEDYLNKEREKATKKGELYGDVDFLSDEDIKELLSEVNCTVRRIVHGETARHVYFWSADNMARDKALDKVYKLKGAYETDENKNINILMPVLVKFLDKKDDSSDNRNTD